MSILREYAQLADRLNKALKLPSVTSIFLPPLESDKHFRDEFGMVALEDGSCGPFYASLPGELAELHGRRTNLVDGPIPAMTFMNDLLSEDECSRAVALGVFNAVSQHVFKRAMGSSWISKLDSKGPHLPPVMIPEKGEWLGMVGYFRPLVEQLNQQGVKVLVLERQPERVVLSEGVRMTEDVRDLEACRVVLCTAATLVNDSLESILEATPHAESFSMVGPTGSGLPDVLFSRGVDTVGGVFFPSQDELFKRLRSGESWKKAGQKYQLQRQTYPGIDALLSRISDSALEGG